MDDSAIISTELNLEENRVTSTKLYSLSVVICWYLFFFRLQEIQSNIYSFVNWIVLFHQLDWFRLIFWTLQNCSIPSTYMQFKLYYFLQKKDFQSFFPLNGYECVKHLYSKTWKMATTIVLTSSSKKDYL